MSRTHNAIRNTKYAILSKMLTLVLSFVSRTIFIYVLGNVYLGVNGLYTDILNALSFAELGFGSALDYLMYAPIANGDEERALRLASPRPQAPAGPAPSVAEAVLMAERALARDNPEAALRQLMHAETRDGDWYYMQGKVLMALEQYESAHQSFREAVRRSPDNNVYRSGALAAVVAQREAETLQGRVKKVFRNILKK